MCKGPEAGPVLVFWGNSKTLMWLEQRVTIGREGGGKGREGAGASRGRHGGLWGGLGLVS